jgi:hypothetical protein
VLAAANRNHKSKRNGFGDYQIDGHELDEEDFTDPEDPDPNQRYTTQQPGCPPGMGGKYDAMAPMKKVSRNGSSSMSRGKKQIQGGYFANRIQYKGQKGDDVNHGAGLMAATPSPDNFN